MSSFRRIDAMAEATGVGSASSICQESRTRIPFPDLRCEPAPEPRGTSPRNAAPGRYRASTRKLTAEQEVAIRALAGTKSLRSLAAEFGVSHETIRAPLRSAGAADFVGRIAAERVRRSPQKMQVPAWPKRRPVVGISRRLDPRSRRARSLPLRAWRTRIPAPDPRRARARWPPAQPSRCPRP